MSFNAALKVRGTRAVVKEAGSIGSWIGSIGPADHPFHTDFGVASEAWIATEDGAVPAARLRAGDKIITGTGSVERLVAVVHVQKENASERVHIARGALGPDLPKADLVVGKSTRLRVQSDLACRLTGSEYALIEAEALIGRPGITQSEGALRDVTHLFLDTQCFHVVEGVAIELFSTSAQWIDTLPFDAHEAVFAALPKLRFDNAAIAYESGLPSLEPREIRQILDGPADFSGGELESFDRVSALGSARAG